MGKEDGKSCQYRNRSHKVIKQSVVHFLGFQALTFRDAWKWPPWALSRSKPDSFRLCSFGRVSPNWPARFSQPTFKHLLLTLGRFYKNTDFESSETKMPIKMLHKLVPHGMSGNTAAPNFASSLPAQQLALKELRLVLLLPLAGLCTVYAGLWKAAGMKLRDFSRN